MVLSGVGVVLAVHLHHKRPGGSAGEDGALRRRRFQPQFLAGQAADGVVPVVVLGDRHDVEVIVVVLLPLHDDRAIAGRGDAVRLVDRPCESGVGQTQRPQINRLGIVVQHKVRRDCGIVGAAIRRVALYHKPPRYAFGQGEVEGEPTGGVGVQALNGIPPRIVIVDEPQTDRRCVADRGAIRVDDGPGDDGVRRRRRGGRRAGEQERGREHDRRQPQDRQVR